MRIDDSVAFVTGSSRGLGRELVLALLKRGARRVYAASRTGDHAVSGAGTDGRLRILRLDVTDPASVGAAARVAHDVTLVVNNAGSMARGGLLQAGIDDVRRDMDTNFYGVLAVTRAFAGILERNGGGGFVNVLSVSALASSPDAGGYSASKAAGHSLTQSMRAELAPCGISVLGVYPGPVDTGMTGGIDLPKADPAEVAGHILDGVERDEEDILPDRMAEQALQAWKRDPKLLERQFAALAAGAAPARDAAA